MLDSRNVKRILRDSAALLLILMIAVLSGSMAEEGKTLEEFGVEVKKSYKKAGENNPLYTQRFGADPGVMTYNGRIYVYMTNDTVEYDAAGKVKENSYSQIRHISCISSDDLVNWTDHGLIPVAGPKGIAPWAVNSWAPCAAHKTVDGKEKFFLYFCNGGNGIGVLTAEDPTGPWRDECGKLLITRSTPNCADVLWLFDPAVMVDEDGTGYLAFGGGVPNGKQANPGTGRIVRLGEDMISLGGDPVTVDAPWLFEDSGINRIGEKYIYSYCSNWQTDGNSLKLTSDAIEYMTSDNPLGPYVYQGELFPNEGRFFGLYGNNHHSIGYLNGEYYLFYHSRPVEQAMGITGNYRSPQMDKIEIAEDGTLKPVRGTMKGVGQLKTLDAGRPVSAATMSDQAGIQVISDGTANRAAGEAGSWIQVSGVAFPENADRITLTGSAENAGKIYVLADSLQSPVLAEIDYPAGENWEASAPLHPTGVRDIYLVFGGQAVLLSWQVK